MRDTEAAEIGAIGDNQDWVKNVTFTPPAWLWSDLPAGTRESPLADPTRATGMDVARSAT